MPILPKQCVLKFTAASRGLRCYCTPLVELDILSRSRDIRNQGRTLPKIDRNFACFWPLIFYRGETPKFLEFSASFEPDSDHVAKFRGDGPRDLGDMAA